jgi:cardiolipin synthase
MKNLANILTITRLVLLPVIIMLFYMPWPWATWTLLALYIVGAATDWLDGWAARRFDQVSDFGRFLDPISDKIYVVTLLLMLIATQHITGLFVLAVVIILVREFLVAGLREFLGPKNIMLPVTRLAKWKTTVQMIATGFLIVGPIHPYAAGTGEALLCVAAVLTVITGWDYVKTGWAHFA